MHILPSELEPLVLLFQHLFLWLSGTATHLKLDKILTLKWFPRTVLFVNIKDRSQVTHPVAYNHL